MVVDPENLIHLFKLFSRHGGYWFLENSEDLNLTIEWSPFMGDGKGKMMESIHYKRCSYVESFYDHAVDKLNEVLSEEYKEKPFREVI